MDHCPPAYDLMVMLCPCTVAVLLLFGVLRLHTTEVYSNCPHAAKQLNRSFALYTSRHARARCRTLCAVSHQSTNSRRPSPLPPEDSATHPHLVHVWHLVSALRSVPWISCIWQVSQLHVRAFEPIHLPEHHIRPAPTSAAAAWLPRGSAVHRRPS